MKLFKGDGECRGGGAIPGRRGVPAIHLPGVGRLEGPGSGVNMEGGAILPHLPSLMPLQGPGKGAGLEGELRGGWQGRVIRHSRLDRESVLWRWGVLGRGASGPEGR